MALSLLSNVSVVWEAYFHWKLCLNHLHCIWALCNPQDSADTSTCEQDLLSVFLWRGTGEKSQPISCVSSMSTSRIVPMSAQARAERRSQDSSTGAQRDRALHRTRVHPGLPWRRGRGRELGWGHQGGVIGWGDSATLTYILTLLCISQGNLKRKPFQHLPHAYKKQGTRSRGAALA